MLALGAAVVKAAIKLWTGSNPFGEEVGGDLTDLLKGRVGSAIDQRKIRRQFEQMEELIANQILAVMGHEFRDLDDGERYAATAAVKDTIECSEFTDSVLFEGNLDPLYLEQFFRRFIGDATRDLSSAGIQLFDRALSRCCAYMIEIADKLPRFQVGAFTELLRRDSQILARIEEVIERLPTPIGNGSPHGRIDTAYRQRIAKVFDRLELFGLDFMAQWYALSIAYVNLTASVPHPDGRDAVRNRTDKFEHWLTEYPRLLINGRAGGGKTTILQWIAVRAARRDFPGTAATLNGLVPFFIRLREYPGQQMPNPEQFLDKVAPLLAPEGPRWPREQLVGGRAFVLVDGVDEVPEAQRREVLQWLRDLTDLFPQSRYVVTTRPGAIADDSLSEAGFTQATLEPMNPGLIRTFIDQWHAAMGEWHKDAAASEQLATYQNHLLRTLDNDRFLSELANTPLLAGLICALNQHLGGQLPRRRGEIFERALGMFHERDRKRAIVGSGRLDLSGTNHLLGDLALWMVRNAAIEVAEEAARGVLARSAASLPDRLHQDHYQHLLLRSGVLREPTAGYVDFVHRTFQEYLAAKALIRDDNVGEIVRNVGDDQWREIVILASGQGNMRQTTDLLRGLLKTTFSGKQQYQRRLLAVACLDEIRGADPAVLRAIDRSIPELIPPRSMDEAEALSHAGERLLPYLRSKVERFGTTAARTSIRAASLIGGSQAMDLIEAIALHTRPRGENRSAVQEELVRSWDYFSGVGYLKRVAMAGNLREIDIDSAWKLTELTSMRGFRSVTLLDFIDDDTNLIDLDDVGIRELVIARSPIRSLTGVIRRWRTIEKVRLLNLPNLRDIQALRNMPDLEELEILNCGDIEFYLPVAKALNLRKYTISSGGERSIFDDSKR